MYFEIVGEITDVETIAARSSIRELEELRRQYGGQRWRKLKGKALVRLGGDKFAKLRFIGTSVTVSAGDV